MWPGAACEHAVAKNLQDIFMYDVGSCPSRLVPLEIIMLPENGLIICAIISIW